MLARCRRLGSRWAFVADARRRLIARPSGDHRSSRSAATKSALVLLGAVRAPRMRHAHHRRRHSKPRAGDRGDGCHARYARRYRQRRALPRASANALLDALLAPKSSTSMTRRQGQWRCGTPPSPHKCQAKACRDPIGGSTPRDRSHISRRPRAAQQIPAPDVIIHATSSGGTQVASPQPAVCLASRRVIGIAADGPVAQI